MKIRNYQDKDFPRLEEILKEANMFYESVDKRGNYQEQIERDPESIIVAEEQGNVIGAIFILYNPVATFLSHLVVDLEYPGRGVGNKLIESAISVLKSRGSETVFGFVEQHNHKALTIYLNKGYLAFPPAIPLEKKL